MTLLPIKLKDVQLAHWFCGALVFFSLLVLGGYWANRLATAADVEEATLREIEHRAVALTEAVSEQTRGAIFNLDLAMLHLAHLHTRMNHLTERDVEDVKTSTPLGLVRRITLIDRSGRAAVTYPAGGAGLLLADREHFRTHASGEQRGLFIGQPIQSRIENEWMIPLSRRLTDRQGNFVGVIAVMVSPKYFAEIYGRLARGRDDVVALVLQDGTFLSRSINLEEYLGKSVRADRPFVGAKAPESGSFRSVSSHEPVDRVFAFRRVSEWPLVTVIGLGVSESLAPLRDGQRREAQSVVAVSVLVLLLVGGICVVVMRLERSLVRVRESDERRALAAAGADELAWEWDVPGKRLRFFGNCRPFFGTAEDEREVAVEDMLQLVHPEERESLVIQPTGDFLRGIGETKEMTFRLRFAGGQYRWVMVRGQRVGFDSAGKVTRALGILIDVDTERRAQVDAAQTREAYRRLIESAGEGIFVVDESGLIRLFNPAAELLLGWRADEVIGQSAHQLFHAEGAGLPLAGGQRCPVIMTLRDGATRHGVRLTYRHKNGRAVPVEVSVAPLVIDRRVDGAVTVVADISQRLSYEAELERLARTDGLTGLWNRRYFVELFGRELKRAERDDSPLTLLMIDIDYFKEVNDRHGHAAGDSVLTALATHFHKQLRVIDLIGRLGGEEFGVGLPGIWLDEALVVAERIRDGLDDMEIAAGDRHLHCTVSIGVAQWDGRESFDTLLARADAALYAAKDGGRNRVVAGQARAGTAGA